MFSAMRLDYVACIKPKVLARGVRTKGPILGAGALALTLFSASAAQAQCVGGGALASPNGLDKTVAMAVAGECSAADRKSTRLNSSHQIISYAVFCFKKKKKI